MARPPKPPKERKENSLRIRLNDEQAKAFAEAAKRDGLDVSAFVRRAAVLRARELGVKI